MITKKIISIKIFPVVVKLFLTLLTLYLYVHYFFPQSWGFFTNEPDVPLYNLYEVHNGIADKAPLLKNNMSYGMGVSLRGRIIYKELYGIINRADLLWKPFTAESTYVITRQASYILVSSASEYNLLKGNYLITKTARPAYYTLTKGEQLYPLKQYILVNIR